MSEATEKMCYACLRVEGKQFYRELRELRLVAWCDFACSFRATKPTWIVTSSLIHFQSDSLPFLAMLRIVGLFSFVVALSFARQKEKCRGKPDFSRPYLTPKTDLEVKVELVPCCSAIWLSKFATETHA